MSYHTREARQYSMDSSYIMKGKGHFPELSKLELEMINDLCDDDKAIFIASQYDGYVKAGYTPTFDRGDAEAQPMIPMTLQQATELINRWGGVQCITPISNDDKEDEVCCLIREVLTYVAPRHYAIKVLNSAPMYDKVLSVFDRTFLNQDAHVGSTAFNLIINPTPGQIAPITESENVIAIGTLSIFDGSDYLLPVVGSYKIMSNFGCAGFRTVSNASTTNKISPDVLMRYQNFVFVGTNALESYNYIRLFDRNKCFKYYYYGVGEEAIRKRYSMQYSDMKALVIFSVKVSPYSVARDGDVLFNVELRDEISNTLLNELIPIAGRLPLSIWDSFGFRYSRTYHKISSGFVIPIHGAGSVLINKRYLIPGINQIKYAYANGAVTNIDNYVEERLTSELSIVRFIRSGKTLYNSNCVHDEDAYHTHMVEVRISKHHVDRGENELSNDYPMFCGYQYWRKCDIQTKRILESTCGVFSCVKQCANNIIFFGLGGDYRVDEQTFLACADDLPRNFKWHNDRVWVGPSVDIRLNEVNGTVIYE